MTDPGKALLGALLAIGGLIATVAILAAIFWQTPALAGTATAKQTCPQSGTRVYTFFTATTTTAISTTDGSVGLDLNCAKKVTFYFSRAWSGGNAGMSIFDVDVSHDATNWYDYGSLKIADAAKTGSSTPYISAATSTVIASMDLEHSTFSQVRCNVTEVTDGSHTCIAQVEY